MNIVDSLKTLMQYAAPHHPLSRFSGWVANCENPKIKNWIIDTFIAYYGVDMALAKESDPHVYPSFNQFFIRQLKPELRPIAYGENNFVSPVDGSISQIGQIKTGKIFQAKGFDFSLEQLTAESSASLAPYQNGSFATIYLAPKDYHRIHMPVTAELKAMTYIPGSLFSVNPHTTQSVPTLFARNERVVCHFMTTHGPLLIILVGAMIVASIHVGWHGAVTSQHNSIQRWNYPTDDKPILLTQGQELGHFELGSTVIVVAPNDLHWNAECNAGTAVQMGQKIGVFTQVDKS